MALVLLVIAGSGLGPVPTVAHAAAMAPGGGPAAEGTRWGWPLPGVPVVDRRFEPPATRFSAGHRGVDLRAAVGAPVLAAAAGRVSYAGLLAGRGVVVVVHGELRTTYEPVLAAVAVGQTVSRGQRLGTLTAGHASCRPGTACLHWGLLRGQTYLDPLQLVRGRIRLLPLAAGAGAAAPPPDPSSSARLTVGPAPPPAAPAAPPAVVAVRQGNRWPAGAGVAGAAVLAAGGVLRRRRGVPGPGPAATG